jgi:hypothetical protein
MEYRKSFDEKYTACIAEIGNQDVTKKAGILGADLKDGLLTLSFFNRWINFSKDGFNAADGDALTTAVTLTLCRYLSLCPDKIPEGSGHLITFRELSDSGPLFSSFTANTNKIIESAFTGKLELLRSRCLQLGGTDTEMPSFDLSMQFMALPRIPIILNFNDRDDLMPATANFLYHDDATRYLDIECLMITCTYLTGQLIQGTL